MCLIQAGICQELPELQEGTLIKVKTLNVLNSNENRVGDIVEFEVVDDIIDNNLTIIQRGTKATGTITKAKKSSLLGGPGQLDFTIDYVTAVNGRKIKLRSTQEFRKEDKRYGVAAAAILVNPLFLLIKGKNVQIDPATEFMCYIDKS